MISTFTLIFGTVPENVTSFYTFLVSLSLVRLCLFQCTHHLPSPIWGNFLFSHEAVRYFLMCQSRVSLSVRSFMRARTQTDWSPDTHVPIWSFIHTLLLPLGSSGNWTLEKWCSSLDWCWCCCKLLHVSQLYNAVQSHQSLK